MVRKKGRHSKGRTTDTDTSVVDDFEWWLRDTQPTTIINRRWRRPRADGLHPRRRSTDAPLDTEIRTDDVTNQVDEEPFDPTMLFAEMVARPAPGVAHDTQPWSVLGLTSDVTWADVVARHRELAKVHHPDRQGLDTSASDPSSCEPNSADDARMAEINAAVAELSRIYRISGDR